MLFSFIRGALATAVCMIFAIAFMTPLRQWSQLGGRDWLLGAAVVAATSTLVGTVAAIGWMFLRRDRWGRRKDHDPTDILPFL
jgi:hypothetical protein